MKTAESNKTQLENQLKTEKDKLDEAEQDLNSLRKEKSKIEGKILGLEKELREERRKTVEVREDLEREIANLKRKSMSNDPSALRIQELSQKNDGELFNRKLLYSTNSNIFQNRFDVET